MISERFTKLIGRKVKINRCIFSYKKEIKEPEEFDVLNVRRGISIIMDINTLKAKYRTVELLLKNNNMKKAQ